jgi:hypothetical protein
MVQPRPTRRDPEPLPGYPVAPPADDGHLIRNEATRAWIYRIAVALLALAIALQLVPLDISDELGEVITAVLGVGSAGLAAANTSTRRK